ncbi:TLR adapter interacting with SLC15A4 on the lysosome-like [Ascaphus truei]|uniref:TLR adapter interacting with SLC15A4 on the lysosome-like n=1 Tax=Ascaphus truei TaxID=8439 RepID=UPI003F5A2980
MLSEASLSRLMYKESMYQGINNAHENTGSRDNHLEDAQGVQLGREAQNALNPRAEATSHNKDQHFVRSKEKLCTKDHGDTIGHASEPLYIPKRDQNNDNPLDLYTSWSSMYASIYKNYPDLHIGGDHILNKKDSGCVLDLECEFQDGPVLLSVDIATGTPPADQVLEKPSVLSVLHGEENQDRSITLCNAPFSNSILNGYVDSKMHELYKQFLEENMTTCDSSTSLLFSSMLMNNVNRISMQLTHEQKVEQSKARKAILHFLYSANSGNSSEFVTPVLHISNLESKKNSETSSNKTFRLRKESQTAPKM